MPNWILVNARTGALGLLAIAAAAGCGTAANTDANPKDARTTPVYNKTTGRLEQIVSDRDGDGKPDTRAYMDGTAIKYIEIDRDGDGKTDRWEHYTAAPATGRKGTPTNVIERADEAGEADQKITRREFYRQGVLTRTEEDTDRDGRMDKWEHYEATVLTRVEFDLAGKGYPDRRLVYGADGNVVRIEVDPDGDGKFDAAQVPPPGEVEASEMVTGAPPKPGSAATIDEGSATSVSVLYLPGTARDRSLVRERLARCGAQTTLAGSVTEALQAVATRKFALCLFNLADDRAAIAAIRVVRARHPHMPIAAIVDPAKPEAAGEAIHAGVTDLLPWPIEERDLSAIVVNVLERLSVEHPARGRDSADLFAQSPAMRLVMELVHGSAEVRGGVCICGEPGTGRGLVARAIHGRRPEADRPFITVDCAGEAPQELERRLFGVVGDARQTGGEKATLERLGRAGALVMAAGGTLFLKNPVEAPARVQAKLARVLRDGEAWIVEQRATVELDVRPIAAVDGGVDASVEEGRLRADLYERLAQVRIDMPSLRRRRENLPLLAMHLLRHACEAQGVAPKTFSRSALALLTALPWHGNGGEMRALIESLVRSVERLVIQLDDLLDQASLDGMPARFDPGVTLRDAKARFERDCISAVLMRHHGRVGEAAKALGIQRTNLYRKVRQLNVARSLLSSRK